MRYFLFIVIFSSTHFVFSQSDTGHSIAIKSNMAVNGLPILPFSGKVIRTVPNNPNAKSDTLILLADPKNLRAIEHTKYQVSKQPEK